MKGKRSPDSESDATQSADTGSETHASSSGEPEDADGEKIAEHADGEKMAEEDVAEDVAEEIVADLGKKGWKRRGGKAGPSESCEPEPRKGEGGKEAKNYLRGKRGIHKKESWRSGVLIHFHTDRLEVSEDGVGAKERQKWEYVFQARFSAPQFWLFVDVEVHRTSSRLRRWWGISGSGFGRTSGFYDSAPLVYRREDESEGERV